LTTLLRALVLWVTELSWVRKVMTEHRLARRVAERFVAGDTLESGMAASEDLDRHGISAMLDYLGENVESASQAAGAADHYIRALKRIRESPDIDCNISVKLTQLGLDVSIDLCRENMERVLQVASESNPPTLVMIDMESREYVDRTLDVYLTLRERYPNVGVCLQSSLFRTAEDCRRIAGPRAVVRMAKGAYLEPPDVAYRSRGDVQRSYARVSATLLAAGSTVHFATHDEKLIKEARRFVHRRGIPENRYEFQMLYGIRRDLQSRLVGRNEPVRVYVPYGTQWYPYLTRRLAERPGNIWFFVSNAVRLGG
jgi:proline dehydrogenase